jgi:ABC-type multidrug transport system ATPase subunit
MHICTYFLRVQDVKSKDLSPGELKRLSIAEEIVHGPMLLLVDEPVTGLAPKDAAVVMNVFREMVNQDRTVIVTLHQV